MKVAWEEFETRAKEVLEPYRGKFKSVTGPKRSGAIASVFASHYLGLVWFPYGREIPSILKPSLIIDTAIMSGRSLRRCKKMVGEDCEMVALFKEPPVVSFFYERK